MTTAACALPGHFAAWTAADVAAIRAHPVPATKVPGLEPYCQPILANGVVRYVGEPVAVVFAENDYLAEDAADLVHVEVEALPGGARRRRRPHDLPARSQH